MRFKGVALFLFKRYRTVANIKYLSYLVVVIIKEQSNTYTMNNIEETNNFNLDYTAEFIHWVVSSGNKHRLANEFAQLDLEFMAHKILGNANLHEKMTKVLEAFEKYENGTPIEDITV